MLGFLCNGRYHVDDEDDQQSMAYSQNSPRNKNRLEKKKVTKLVIGTPTDFKHNGHMGYDELSNPQVWGDIERDIALNLPDNSTSPRSTALSLPSPTSTEPFASSLSTSVSASVRRKPVPQIPGSIRSQASVSHSTEGGYPGQYTATPATRSRRPSASQEQQLVPLLGANAPRNGAEPNYVTQTAKIRWDGNMAEIEKAIQESSYRSSLPSRPTRI